MVTWCASPSTGAEARLVRRIYGRACPSQWPRAHVASVPRRWLSFKNINKLNSTSLSRAIPLFRFRHACVHHFLRNPTLRAGLGRLAIDTVSLPRSHWQGFHQHFWALVTFGRPLVNAPLQITLLRILAKSAQWLRWERNSVGYIANQPTTLAKTLECGHRVWAIGSAP